MSRDRYCLVQDNSGHWYLIPVEQWASWKAWCRLPEEDGYSWDPTDFARRLGMHPSFTTFTDPWPDTDAPWSITKKDSDG